MKLSRVITLPAIAFLLGSTVTQPHAQTPTPQAPAASTSAPTSGSDKKAVSKECSDQANQKGLHGKERRKFRSECKKNGGKS
jgi:hypothetical protein